MTDPAEERMSDGPENRKIVLLPITSLKPYAGNPRRHSAKQIRQIADSIGRFAFANPIRMASNLRAPGIEIQSSRADVRGRRVISLFFAPDPAKDRQ